MRQTADQKKSELARLKEKLKDIEKESHPRVYGASNGDLVEALRREGDGSPKRVFLEPRNWQPRPLGVGQRGCSMGAVSQLFFRTARWHAPPPSFALAVSLF